MTGPKATSCIVGECASSFPYREECALVASGCCARDMLAAAARWPDGVHFPMDLAPGGNPFVNALERENFVTVNHEITRAVPSPTPSQTSEVARLNPQETFDADPS